MTDLPTCLPAPPQMRTLNVIEVTYCIERRSDGLHHNHVALYDAETSERYIDICTLEPDR